MKKLFVVLTLLFTVVTLTVTATACDNATYFKDDYIPKYNDAFYDSAVDWISEDFQAKNRVKTVGFIDDDTENELPETRTFIIIDSDRFDEVFVKDINELSVDFDKQFVVVYTFAVEYTLPAFILDMDINGKTLTVDYTIPKTEGVGSATKPYQRWFVLVADKLDVDAVVFNEIYTYYKDK